MATPSGFAPHRFRLFPVRSPLLRESRLLSFPRVTEMFQFTRFPLPALCVQAGVTPHDECRVSPFGHPRIEARSTAPRGFSQSPTSFIGSRRQGIHRWPFVAWKIRNTKRCSCSLCNSQGTTTPGSEDPGNPNGGCDPRGSSSAGCVRCCAEAVDPLPESGTEDGGSETSSRWPGNPKVQPARLLELGPNSQ